MDKPRCKRDILTQLKKLNIEHNMIHFISARKALEDRVDGHKVSDSADPLLTNFNHFEKHLKK
ncbi:hypothetical protein U2071_15665, partial [Listeria monocytogenes]|uniref:hypothetical protein n=1 Tax=Listeria monocytogenes TaxID=1639 RepID=UPI002FDC73C1